MRLFDKFPLAASGWPYLISAVFLAVVAQALDVWFLYVPLWIIAAFTAFFFRDPPRHHHALPGQVISPADGLVVVSEEVDCPSLSGGRAHLLSIFMNLHDVHVNRAPISGKALAIKHMPGRYMPADKRAATLQNERMEMVLERRDGVRIMVAQVAGLVARRIECSVTPGDNLLKGQRYGMIRFGSRLDVYLPLGSQPRVKPGQRVKAGISVIGEL